MVSSLSPWARHGERPPRAYSTLDHDTFSRMIQCILRVLEASWVDTDKTAMALRDDNRDTDNSPYIFSLVAHFEQNWSSLPLPNVMSCHGSLSEVTPQDDLAIVWQA